MNGERREALAQASAAAAELYSREHLAERMLTELAMSTDRSGTGRGPTPQSSEAERSQPESSEDAERAERATDSERAA